MAIGVLLFLAMMLFLLGFQNFNREREFQLKRLIGLEKSSTKKEKKQMFKSSADLMSQSALALSGEAFFLICVISAVSTGIIGSIFFSHPLIGLILLPVGFNLPRMWAKQKIKKRADLMIEQMTTALDIVATVLRSGGQFTRALARVAEKVPAPLGTEFREILNDINAGKTVSEALSMAEKRIPLIEFSIFALSYRINSQTGGNLAEVYDEKSTDLNEQKRIIEVMNSYTSQGRTSATIVAAMPFVVIAIVRILSPDYLDPLLETTWGPVIVALCVGCIIMGYRLTRSMATFTKL